MKSLKRTQRQRALGKGDYPAEWSEIAAAVKEMAGWRCERCGHPHETPSARVQCDGPCTHVEDGKQRVLTVHHLDMDPANCQLNNLVALCQSCHLSIQARVDWRQAYMLPLPVWMAERWKDFRKGAEREPSE